MKPVGKKRAVGVNFDFLKYSQNLKYRSVLCLWSILDHTKVIFTPFTCTIFPVRPILYQLNPTEILGKFPGNFPESSKKFLGNFPDTQPTPLPPPLPPIPPPTPHSYPEIEKSFFSLTFFKPHFLHFQFWLQPHVFSHQLQIWYVKGVFMLLVGKRCHFWHNLYRKWL